MRVTKSQNGNVSLFDSGAVTGVSNDTLSRFLLALSGRAEICVERRKLQRDPERQTRHDVRQMRTRTGMDAESARRAEGGNLLSYDRTVRNDREVIGKIWFSDYRFSERVSNSRLDISS